MPEFSQLGAKYRDKKETEEKTLREMATALNEMASNGKRGTGLRKRDRLSSLQKAHDELRARDVQLALQGDDSGADHVERFLASGGTVSDALRCVQEHHRVRRLAKSREQKAEDRALEKYHQETGTSLVQSTFQAAGGGCGTQ